jgi:CheY-like chemotaxis protein
MSIETVINFSSAGSFLSGLRVLCVDALTEEREHFSRLLKQGGAQVTTVVSAREAMRVFERIRPEVVVSQLRLPDEDGYAFMRAIRALPLERGGQTPAIAVAERATQRDRTRALAAGYNALLGKPVELRDLVGAFQGIVRQVEETRKLRQALLSRREEQRDLRERLRVKRANLKAQSARRDAARERRDRAWVSEIAAAGTSGFPDTPAAWGFGADIAAHDLGASPGGARKNRLLAALPLHERQRIAPHLERIHLDGQQTVYDSCEPLRHAFFPIDCVTSSIRMLETGKTVAVATVGSDGMLGLPIVLGSRNASSWTRVLIAGDALRISAPALRSLLGNCDSLRQLLLQYTHAQMEEISQVAACNRLHQLEGQLCQWLLTVSDRLGSNELLLTQEAIAFDLGTRRSSVSVAAEGLRKAGSIDYARGRITIVDRGGLEAASCECYHLIRERFDSLLPPRK